MQKLAIITGGNSGLGFQSSMRAINAGYSVCLASRDLEKAEQAKALLVNHNPQSTIHIKQLDLADLNSVRHFCSTFAFQWDVLLNNAGAKIEKPLKTTAQGFEWHVGVNYLGHFALTAGLMPLANSGARVSTVSSIVARRGELDFLLDSAANEFNERQAYANSKLMNLVFALELAERFRGTEFISTASHPGFARASFYGSWAVRVAEYALAQSARLGSDSIWSSTSSSNGSYLAPRHFELWGKAGQGRIPEFSCNQRKEFWQRSEELTGIEFPKLEIESRC